VTEPGSGAARTLRAAAEYFVPGSSIDATPGAADVEADRFLSHYLDFVLPGLASGVPELLDNLARERFDGRAFADLTLDERGAVFDALETHEVEQLRELPSLIGLLSVAAVYGEWTGQDADGVLVRKPLGWQLAGFEGPTRARPRAMREP
jgi:hypothetical protein